MASRELPRPSKLGIAWVMNKAFISLLTRLLTSPIRRPFSSSGAPTLFKDVMYAMMRTQLRGLNLSQERYLNKSTDDTYLEFCEKSKIAPNSITLDTGRKAHWVGSPSANTTLVYFHGGGYALPATLFHFQFLQGLIDALNANGQDISVLFLGYSLAPEHPFPQQLIEATSLLRHLLTDLSRSPSSLILAGDSAGGNIALSLLSHILHPHPSVSPLELSEPLKGAILLSPWVSFRSDDDSVRTNAQSDMFDTTPLHRWSHAFMATVPERGVDAVGDPWSEARRAPPSWWHGMDKIVDQVLIWGGGGEILIDGIKELGYRFQGAFGDNCEVVITKRAAHDEMILDAAFGYKEPGEGTKTVERWLRSKL